MMNIKVFLSQSLEMEGLESTKSRRSIFGERLKVYDKGGGLNGSGREAVLALDNKRCKCQKPKHKEAIKKPDKLMCTADPIIPKKKSPDINHSKRKHILCLGLAVPLLPEENLQIKRKKLLEKAQACEENQQVQELQEAMETKDPYRDAIDCVAYKVKGFTEIDARDFVRGHLTEQECGAIVYGVSNQRGAKYYHPDRNLDSNFNQSRSFLKKLKLMLEAAESSSPNNTKIRFTEAILDYFWIPNGSWELEHWQSQFFSETLVGLAEQDLLFGHVYLPFTLHCFTQVLATQKSLLQCYNIKFLRQEDLRSVSLWKGTQAIDETFCQQVLGKHRNQEETYCSFDSQKFKEEFNEASISKEEMLGIALQLEDFALIRFIDLEVLAWDKRDALKGKSQSKSLPGRISGLKDPKYVQRGFKINAKPTQPVKAK